MSRAYAELVDEVRSLPADARRDLRLLIDHSLIEERRQEILENHRRSQAELEAGELRFSSDLKVLLADLED